VASEPLTELGYPKVVAVENHTGLLAQLAVQLVKNIVLDENSGNKILGELKDGVDDSGEEALDAHNGHGWHLRPQWEHEGVVGLILDQVVEQSKFLAFVGVRCLFF
jgi:hypothetical protein